MAQGEKQGWWQCCTCKQSFTGAIEIGLAEELWSRVRDQPMGSKDRLYAAGILNRALYGQGKYAEAEQMLRELLHAQRRMLGPEHPSTLGTTCDLASYLNKQGKHAEAELMQRELGLLDLQ